MVLLLIDTRETLKEFGRFDTVQRHGGWLQQLKLQFCRGRLYCLREQRLASRMQRMVGGRSVRRGFLCDWHSFLLASQQQTENGNITFLATFFFFSKDGVLKGVVSRLLL